jgi:hypothetical protein
MKSGNCGLAKAKTFSTDLEYLKGNSDRYNDFSNADKRAYTERLQDLSDEDLEDFVRTMGEKQEFKGSTAVAYGAMQWIGAIVGGLRNTASTAMGANGRVTPESLVGALVTDVGSTIGMMKGITAGNPVLGGESAPPINDSFDPMVSGNDSPLNSGGGQISDPSGLNGAQNTDSLLGTPDPSMPQSSDFTEERQFVEPIQGSDGC